MIWPGEESCGETNEGVHVIKKTVRKDDLLFHAVHGLCRVTGVSKRPASNEDDYALLPVSTNRAKVRFVISESSFESSGFNKLITAKDAHSILDYFRTREKKESRYGRAWQAAVMISSESERRDLVKDNRKQQRLSVSVRNLSSELAFVLNMKVPEITERIRKNLRAVSDIHPQVLHALACADRG